MTVIYVHCTGIEYLKLKINLGHIKYKIEKNEH